MPLIEETETRSKDLGLDQADGLTHVGGRVLEIRKEKSRDAARSRRGKENYEFYELAKLLPLPAAITSQLDKASIIRLSISYLKLRDFCGHGDPSWSRDGQSHSKSLKGGPRRNTGISGDPFDIHQGAHILQSLDGFAFALSNDGRFLYISETVSIYLGLSQVEMAGSSIFDYIHTQDHQELADQLGLTLASVSGTLSSPASPTVDSPMSSRAITPPLSDRMPVMSPSLEKSCSRSFCIRMKSTLTKRGVHSRSSGYRVVLIIGQFRPQINYNVGRKCPGPLLGLSGVAIALPPPTVTELRIEADTFIMRLTAQFKVIYCENVISSLTDWKCDDLMGRELYDFCHPADAHHMRKLHKDLLLKGQVVSPSMRLLNKGGGYIWVSICCTSLYSSKTSDDQTVLAVIQTISSIEHRGVAMDASQLPHATNATSEPSNTNKEVDMLIAEEGLPSTPSSVRSMTSGVSARESPEITGTQRVDTPESSSVFPSGIDNDFLLDENIENETETAKYDTKLSRRKTDRPRKRKRESEEVVQMQNVFNDDGNHDNLSDSSEHKSVLTEDNKTVSSLNISPGQTSFPSSPETVQSPQPLQLAPEDLSVRPEVNKTLNETSRVSKVNSVISSSVHELEKAMNRHLPAIKHDFLHDNVGSTLNTHKSAVHRTGDVLPNAHTFSSPFQISDVYTNRESVIRSGLRSKGLNGEAGVTSLASYPSGDLTIHRDQLQLHIPYISVNTKHVLPSQKDLVSQSDELAMSNPATDLVPDKLSSTFHDTSALKDCMGIRHGRSLVSKHFEMAHDVGSEMTKSRNQHLASYQYHSSDLGNFAYDSVQPSSMLYDPRHSPNNGVWYGSGYHS